MICFWPDQWQSVLEGKQCIGQWVTIYVTYDFERNAKWIKGEVKDFDTTDNMYIIQIFGGNYVETIPGNVLTEFPTVGFVAILVTHGAIPWRDSMDVVYSIELFSLDVSPLNSSQMD